MATIPRWRSALLFLAATLPVIHGGTCTLSVNKGGCFTCSRSCPAGQTWSRESCGLFNRFCRDVCTLYGCCTGYTGAGCNTPICNSCLQGQCVSPGNCVCNAGWTGSTCGTCIRKTGCVYGTCSSAFECNCNSGWSGSNCNICVPRVGCRQGTCSNPGECNCSPGWSGQICDTPVCLVACANGACTAPGMCTCSSGWGKDGSGSCTIAQKSPSCVYGTAGGVPFGCVCNSGWRGPNCDQAICRAGCSAIYGSCVGTPNSCTCSAGWTGTNCDQCVPLAGCLQGTCQQPDQCNCLPGYTGARCNIPVCAAGCLNGFCTTPGTCTCNAGWTGTLCTTAICTVRCDPVRGSCTRPYTCNCIAGYSNTSLCTQPICRDGCRGSCTQPGGCDCAAGYTGLLCDTPVCSNCQNGVCVAPEVCNCTTPTLWNGPNCNNPVCAATCKTARCQLPGSCDCLDTPFYGPNCNLPICRTGCAITKGGTCTTPGGCVCSAGWSGTNCDVAICAAGCNARTGSCSTPGACVCASGWTGTLCNEAVCSAGCSRDNGFCTEPGTCQCRDPTRWTGAFCTTAVCRTGCAYGTCTTPGTCVCSADYSGPLCDVPICTSCVRGTCIRPGVCQCDSGWTGSSCNTAICRAGCSPTYGSCVNSPGNCNCIADSRGVALWSGPQCVAPVCALGCLRGSCVNPRECNCSNGWSGPLCDVAVCRDGCLNGNCVNKPFGCDCFTGWSGATCATDINECLVNNGGCSQYANCTNTPGSFFCTCLPGFQQIGSGMGANGCSDINECSINNGNCSQICTNAIGSFACSCLPGYQGSGVGPGGCQNIDECALNISRCSAVATCIDVVGSYACQCNPGYAGNGFNCTDVDECQQGTFQCSPQSSGCINTPGSHTCGPCISGYQGDGKSCTPTGSITIAPFSLSQGGYFGGAVEIVILCSAAGPASVHYTISGLSASRYNVSSAVPGALNGSIVNFAANSNTSLYLTLFATTDFVPQTTLVMTLSQPGGAAFNISAPASLSVVVQANGAPSGVVNFQFITPVDVAVEQLIPVSIIRTLPANAVSAPALIVSWTTTTVPAVNGTAAFAANDTSAVISLMVPNDGVPRLPYSAALRLLPTGNVTLGLQAASTLNLPPSNHPYGYFAFSTTTASTAQGANMIVSVTRVQGGGAFGAVSVLVSCVPGSADTSQYTCPAATLVWADGDSSAKNYTIQITLDDVPRLASWFTVVLQAPTGGADLNEDQSRVMVSIAPSNYPNGYLEFLVSDGSVEVGNSYDIQATRTQGTFGAVSVVFVVTCTNQSIQTLLSVTNGTLAFGAGSSFASVAIAVRMPDSAFGTAACQVQFRSSTLTGGLVINPTKARFTLSITDYSLNPFGIFSLNRAALSALPSPLTLNMTFTIPIVRNGSNFDSVAVLVSVASDPGFQLSFRPESGIVTFAANQGLQTLFCTVLAPRTPQPITTFSLVLSIDSTYEAGFTDGAAIGAGTWSGVLEASGAPAGVLAFPSRSVTAAVGTTVNVVLARNGSTTAAVAINYTITAPSTATLNVTDVGAGMVSFASGQRTASISLTLANSSLPTLQQQLIVTLGTSNTTDAFVSTRSTCVVTVQPNNLPYGLFSMGAPATTMVNKMLGGVVNVPVVRGAGALGAATVTLAVSGNATARQDYTLTPSTLSFAAGQVSATAQLQLVNNGQPSLVETAVVTVTSVQPSDGLLAGVAAGSSVTVVVQAANGVYGVFGLVGPANSTVAAGPTPIVNMTVVRTGGLTGAVRVRFGQNNVQAVAGLNYVLLQPNGQSPATPSPTSFVDFADGQANATISIMLISRPSLTPTRRSVESPSLALQLYSCAVWNPFNGDYEINPGCTVNAGQPTQLNVISNCVAYGCTNVASCDEAWPAPRCNCASGFTGSTCGSAASTAGSSSSSSIIPIIVAVCGGIILLVIIVLLVRRHRNRTKTSNSSLVATFNADPGARPAVFVNPTFSDSTAQSIYYSEVGPGGAPVPHPYNRLRPNSGSNMQNNFAESTTDAPTPQGYFDVQPSEENPVYTLGREPSLRHYSLGMSGDATMYPIVPGGDYSSPASTAYAQAGAADAGYREVTPMAGARGGSARDANKGLDGGYMAAQAANSYAPVVPVGAAGSYMAVQAGGGAGSYMAVQPGAGAASYMAVQPADFAVPTADGGYLSTRALAGSDGGYMAAGALQQSGSDGGYLVTRPAPGMDAGYAAVGSFAVPTSDGGYMTTRPALAADTGYAAVSPVTGSGAYAAVHPATTGYAMLPGAASGEELAYDEVRIFNGGSVQAKPAGLWRDEWVYPPLGRAEVDAALYSGGKEDGRFLVREKEKGVYALSVIHMGAVCHHLLVRDKSGWHVNGFEVPHCKSLGDVVEYLRVPRLNVNQPQALTAPVHK